MSTTPPPAPTRQSLRRGLIAAVAILLAVAPTASSGAEPAGRPRLLAHVMPWYEAPPTSRGWGWHWTMNAFDPSAEVQGRPSIASWYTPEIGPYDSADPAVIEYQILTMKVAGIDGVIVDWYGRTDFRDHATLHRATTLLVEAAQRAGMTFAICYEDQTIPALVEAGRIAPADRVPHALAELRWLAETWFPSPAYARLDGLPLLLSFGQSGLDDAEWSRVLRELGRPVAYLSEHRRRPDAAGGFDWPVPGEGVAAARAFNARSADWPQRIPVVFPRFHDIYAEAKVHASWGAIPDDDGATFRETLEAALSTGAAVVQVATWNDWGEGTMVEPSREFGRRDLLLLQAARRRRDPAFAWTAADLDLPRALLDGRREGRVDDRDRLDRCALAIADGRGDEARRLLAARP